MDDFFFYRDSFDDYLANLRNVLKKCQGKHLTLNWQKMSFYGNRGIILEHNISN